MINALNAANAYRNQLKLQQGLEENGSKAGDASPSFSQMVESAVKSSVDNQRQTEALQMNSLTGNNVDLADLVTAVSNAELTLNTVVAVRDKIIGAYQEIIRMPI